MEAAGLLSRRRDSADERVVRITLTEKGREIVASAACIPSEVLRASGLTLDQLGAMEQELVALRAQLQGHAVD